MTGRTRILFLAEAVTLAHVGRPVALATALDAEHYDIHFAHCPRYRPLLGELSFTEHHIESISPQQFMAALAAGKPLYDLTTLMKYVKADLKLIADIKPDIVIGDFRLSLAVSAELAAIPYVTISNACWSPYTKQRYPVPELPLTRALGPTAGQWLFSLGRPLAFALHCLPMHRLRRRFGLKSLGFSLQEVYTHANYTLYADLPGQYSTSHLPPNHHFIGPVIWSPRLTLPPWCQHLPADRPLIYVTLGSSGQADLLPQIITALGQLDVTALISTAGAALPTSIPNNVFLDTYLPGEEVAQMASLVICNGGSPTTYQALASGKPVIGIAANLDQHLNMQSLTAAGVAILIRSDQFTATELSRAIARLLHDETYALAARQQADQFAQYDCAAQFRKIIATVSSTTVPMNR